MAERPNITSDIVEHSLVRMSHNAHFMEVAGREREKEVGWLVASPGMLVGDIHPQYDEIVRSDDCYHTSTRLRGSERRLNGGTLVEAQSIVLPTHLDNDGIDAFFEGFEQNPALFRRFGYVALNEPGFPIFNPTKTSTLGYIDTNSTRVQLAAEGVSLYLNNPSGLHSSEVPVEEIQETIYLTRERRVVYLEKISDSLRTQFGL